MTVISECIYTSEGVSPIIPAINLDQVCLEFSLNKEESKTVRNGVNIYCSDSKITRIVQSLLYYPQSVLKNSSWQNAIKVLESKIDGEKRKEASIFLLNYCLTKQRVFKNQHPLPISWEHWIRCELGSLTLTKCLDTFSCTKK